MHSPSISCMMIWKTNIRWLASLPFLIHHWMIVRANNVKHRKRTETVGENPLNWLSRIRREGLARLDPSYRLRVHFIFRLHSKCFSMYCSALCLGVEGEKETKEGSTERNHQMRTFRDGRNLSNEWKLTDRRKNVDKSPAFIAFSLVVFLPP